MLTLLLVMAGGAVGALGRFLTDRFLTTRLPGRLPWGTLTVNVAGSLLLGLLTGMTTNGPGTSPDHIHALVGTGFCGALTTYSTFSHETVRLATDGPAGQRTALLNVVLNLGLGIGAAAAGWLLVR